jgi:hypothetical protein
MARTIIKTELPVDQNAHAIQVLVGSGTRVNLTATGTSSRSALPAGASEMVIVRASDYIWLNFGASNNTASNGVGSILCAPGEGAYPIGTATHVAVLQVGVADVAVQVEGLKKSDS